MILLHLLPDSLLASIVHAMVILGLLGTILGYFLNYIPGIVQYRIPIKVISTLLFLSGIYFEGGYSNEMKWRDRVREVEAKLAIAEQKATTVNTVIQERVVEKIKVVKEKVAVTNTIIQKQKEFINAECKIPDVAIEIYNNSLKQSMDNSHE